MEDFEKFYQDLDIKNFNNIKNKIELIVKKTGKSEKEIISDIQKLKKEFDTIITDLEAIIEIYMNKLGIKEDIKPVSSFKKINELEVGDYVNVKGKVYSLRSSEKYASLRLGDGTGFIRVVTFDPKKFLDIYEGNEISIYDALVKEGFNGNKELVMNNRSRIEQDIKFKYERKDLKDLKEGDLIELIAIIKKIFEPREVEREFDKKIIKKTVTPLILTDGFNEIFSYVNYPFDRNNELKSFIIRGKVFKSKDGNLKINISSFLHINFNKELENLVKNNEN